MEMGCHVPRPSRTPLPPTHTHLFVHTPHTLLVPIPYHPLVCVAVPVQRVSDVYAQQCAEVADASLPAAAATELVGHMLQLQAEGLPAAQVGVTQGEVCTAS